VFSPDLFASHTNILSGLFLQPSLSACSSSFSSSAASLHVVAVARVFSLSGEPAGRKVEHLLDMPLLNIPVPNLITATTPMTQQLLPSTPLLLRKAITIKARIRDTSVDSNRVWNCSNRRTRTPGEEVSASHFGEG